MTLPMGLNRISWKLVIRELIEIYRRKPYRLGQIGLVGNTVAAKINAEVLIPYRWV